jgi:hypothetical protein
MERVRKSQAELSENEWDAFTNALKVLRKSTKKVNYDYLAMIHAHHRHLGQAHERYTFLPWHREYLFVFEDALRAIDSTVTVPYWDWTKDPELPSKLADSTEWGVMRAMGAGDKISRKRKDDVDLAMSKTTFQAFHDRIDSPHGAVHIQVGGVDELTGRPLGEKWQT